MPGRFGIAIASTNRCGKLPAGEQRRTELNVIEAQRVLLQRGQVAFFFDHAGEKSGIRLAQLAQQHEDADVLQQAGDERLVARLIPQLLGEQPGRDGARQRVRPIPAQLRAATSANSASGKLNPSTSSFSGLMPNRPIA